MNRQKKQLLPAKICGIRLRKCGAVFALLTILNGCAFMERMNNSEHLGGYSRSSMNNPLNENYKAANTTSTATNNAIISFVKGDLEDAEKNIRIALDANPNDPYALLIGGIVYEQLGRPNRARQHYEDLMISGAADPSILSGFVMQMPKPIAETAKERMKMLELTQGGLVLQDKRSGINQFNMSGQPNSNSVPQNYNPYNNNQYTSSQQPPYQEMPQPLVNLNNSPQPQYPSSLYNPTTNNNEQLLGQSVGDTNLQLFTDSERNAVTRFDIFKKLAEQGLITKEEFYVRRQANIGALLPQTNGPPSVGLDRPVPSAEMIVERLRSLKEAFEKRAITAKEHYSERVLILDALLPAEPKLRAQTPPPPKDMLEGARELRKLEVLLRMGLIAQSEKEQEQKTIEKIVKLGLNQQTIPTSNKAVGMVSEKKNKPENKKDFIAVIGLTPPSTEDDTDNSNEKKKSLSGITIALNKTFDNNNNFF
ncbi:MAG: tetratricopeptide repeat protein [Alphaproteobacteria bacterium]